MARLCPRPRLRLRLRHRRASAPPSASEMAENAIKALQHFLFVDFSSLGRVLSKDYEMEDLERSKKEPKESNADRYSGYQRLCSFGLGSMFWGSVTGILADIEKTDKAPWIEYCFIYSVLALLLMLFGLVASTFPKSAWLAPSLSGLGALHAFIFVLGAFHIASLKYHSYLDECFHSMIGCAIAFAIYWGLSVPDPRPLHIIAKCIAWVIGIMVYGACLSVYYIIIGAIRIFGAFWECFWSSENSIKNRLVARYWVTRGYQGLPGNDNVYQELPDYDNV